MNNKMSSSKWIGYFSCTTILIFFLFTSVAYIVDPFFQFRISKDYELSTYNASGLISNYDYDTLILGSSMIQNFNMDTFRDRLSAKPLNIGIGGMKTPDMIDLLHVAYRTHKAENYYICTDLYLFEKEYEHSSPQYLFQGGVLPKLRYLLSNEVWFHYLPLDVGIVAFKKIGIPLSEKLNIETDIDRFGYWGDQFTFSEDTVLKNYISGQYSISEVNKEKLYERMKQNIDSFLNSLDFDKGQHVFFFPPYSSLYWYDVQNSGYFEVYLKAKEYFIKKAIGYDIVVYDFQSADFTMDLNNYKDLTHYCPEINDWMVECFSNGEYLVTMENYYEYETKLRENTDTFRKHYEYLLTNTN